jgi:hypothetical protein
MLFTVTSTSWFYSPYDFLGLKMSTPTAENRWGLGFVYIFSLFTFESSIVSSLIFLLFYIKRHLFPIETIIRNASKGGKPNRKPYHPYGSEI